MKLLSAGLLLNLFVAAISGRNLRSLEAKQRYIIKHPSDQDPLEALGETTILETSTFDIGTQSYTIASLTTEEAEIVKHTIYNNGSVELDGEIILPSDENQNNDFSANETLVTEETEYLTNIPRCGAKIDNVDIFVIDSVIYKDIPEFKGVDIQNLPSYEDQEPCNSHGTKVASIISGNTVGMITSGNRRIYGIGVFNCIGKGFISSTMQAFSDAIAHDAIARKQGRRTIVNYSGTSPKSSAFDTAAKAVYDAGIPIFVAAGNYAQDACENYSPAGAEGAFTVGSTQFPGDIPAPFTNFGAACTEIYLPGKSVNVIDANTSTIIRSSGTSFSCPQGAAEGALELAKDLAATPEQIYQRITARTVTVTPPDSYPMQVMLSKDACPIQINLIKTIVTNKNDNNRFNTWQLASNNNMLCVKFSAKLMNPDGWMLIGLRQNIITQPTLQIKIGSIVRKKNFAHSIQKSGKTIATTKSRDRVVNMRTTRDFQIEKYNQTLIISYFNLQQKQQLLVTNDDATYTDIAFSAGGNGKVQYTNSMTC